MVVSVDVLPMVLALALAMPRLLRIALQPRRERRALDLYERCRIPGSDAAADISTIVRSFARAQQGSWFDGSGAVALNRSATDPHTASSTDG